MDGQLRQPNIQKQKSQNRHIGDDVLYTLYSTHPAIEPSAYNRCQCYKNVHSDEPHDPMLH